MKYSNVDDTTLDLKKQAKNLLGDGPTTIEQITYKSKTKNKSRKNENLKTPEDLKKTTNLKNIVNSLKQSRQSREPPLHKYGYVMSISTVVLSAKIVNPGIMRCADSSGNISDDSCGDTFNYYKIEETRHNDSHQQTSNDATKEEEDAIEEDRESKKRFKKYLATVAILDNGFVVLMDKVFSSNQYVIVGIVAQMVAKKEEEKEKKGDSNDIENTTFILYKPYVPFDLDEDKIHKETPELYNTKICTYCAEETTGAVKERDIMFHTILPYDFELGNLLVRVLINFGIKISAGGFGKDIKHTPSIILYANNVVKQSLVDVFR